MATSDRQLRLFDSEDTEGRSASARAARSGEIAPKLCDGGPERPAPPESPLAAQSDPDGAAREFATNPAHNVVLEASAGTGKTSVLVARYINLLRMGVDPTNILAITFTRKAAAEMRDRVVSTLRRNAEGSSADRVIWQQVRDRLDEVSISTIDAFCFTLLREFPLEAGLDPGFVIADETEVARLVNDALDRALRRSHAIAVHDPDVALVLLHLSSRRLRQGLAHLLERRIVAWPALNRYLDSGPASLDAATACRRALEGMRDVLKGIRGGLQHFLTEGPIYSPRFGVLADDLRQIASGELLAVLDSVEEGSAALATARSMLDSVRAYFLTKDGAPRQKLTNLGPELFAWAGARKGHQDAVATLAPQVAAVLQRFSRDLNIVLARGVKRMYAIALQEYRRALEDQDRLDFSELLDRAVTLLRQMDEFAQSRYRLESRYHHVLVDEFQDTSRLQWDLVSLLVRSWGEGFGLVHEAPLQPSIFIVGDRKQSIYRFRDADVGVLDRAEEAIAQLRQDPSVRRWIAQSFRAVPALLDFFNDLFGDIQKVTERDDAFKYDEHDRFPEPASEDVLPTSWSEPVLGIVAGKDADTCAEAAAHEIARLLREGSVRDPQTGIARNARYSDIAILFRSRESHREFEQALEARAIPTYVYRGLGFFDADEIKDLSALMRFLASPSSDLRAAAFLRSRFIRLSDPALRLLQPRLASALTSSEPPSAMSALDDEDRRVLELARQHVPGWLAQVDRLPPAELVDLVLVESSYAYELRGPRKFQARENIKKLRGLLRRIQNHGYATLARIAEHLDRLSAGDESNAMIDAIDAVSLMTIHASKGLEFPVVFLVNLGRGSGGIPPAVRVVSDDGDHEPGVRISALSSEKDDRERAREIEDTKRLLYVATTRARDRLYFASVVEDGRKRSPRGSLAEVLPESFMNLFERAAEGANGSELTWSSRTGRVHPFLVCPFDFAQGRREGDEAKTADQALSVLAPAGVDDFGLVQDAVARSHVTVTELTRDESAEISRYGNLRREDHQGPFVGRLVHRLFRARATGNPDALRELAEKLVTEEELTSLTSDAREKSINQAVLQYDRLASCEELQRLLATGDAYFEVPFSLGMDSDLGQADSSGRIEPTKRAMVMRGVIDCVIRQPDGRILVLELKTGQPNPWHREQLELYVTAAREIFRDAVVEGVLLYAE